MITIPVHIPTIKTNNEYDPYKSLNTKITIVDNKIVDSELGEDIKGRIVCIQSEELFVQDDDYGDDFIYNDSYFIVSKNYKLIEIPISEFFTTPEYETLLFIEENRELFSELETDEEIRSLLIL